MEYVEWVKEYLGEAVYDELRREAKVSVRKVDLQETIKYLKDKLDEVK